MTYTKFSQLTQRAMQRKQKARCAVVSAEDEYTMEAVLRAGPGRTDRTHPHRG